MANESGQPMFRYIRGDRVRTPYGDGFVLCKQMPSDTSVQVKLPWGIGYFNLSSVKLIHRKLTTPLPLTIDITSLILSQSNPSSAHTFLQFDPNHLHTNPLIILSLPLCRYSRISRIGDDASSRCRFVGS